MRCVSLSYLVLDFRNHNIEKCLVQLLHNMYSVQLGEVGHSLHRAQTDL
eukprot:COSAG01_NODE_270_length_19812_cov_77.078324_5_plen_49_part_00